MGSGLLSTFERTQCQIDSCQAGALRNVRFFWCLSCAHGTDNMNITSVPKTLRQAVHNLEATTWKSEWRPLTFPHDVCIAMKSLTIQLSACAWDWNICGLKRECERLAIGTLVYKGPLLTTHIDASYARRRLSNQHPHRVLWQQPKVYQSLTPPSACPCHLKMKEPRT